MEKSVPLLSVSGLKVFAAGAATDQTLVRGVSFDIHRGESLGIVGESGSGKTMTLKSLVQLLPDGVHADGDIRLNGEDVLKKSEKQMRKIRGSSIGLLMQDPFTMLNPLQTAGATIEESLRANARGSRRLFQQEVVERLAEVGLEADVAKKYPFQLSGGMLQRVGIAAALACDPQILLADEPTTALDVTVQAEVLQLIGDLQAKRKMGLILVTHDLQVAFTVCERLLVMYAGSIVEDSPSKSLTAEPRHPYSLGLLLSELTPSHYIPKLTAIPGAVPSPDSVVSQCSFADRCGWAIDACFQGVPALTTIAPERSVACIRSDEIRPEMVALRLAKGGSGTRQPVAGQRVLAVENLRKVYVSQPMFGRRSRTTALDDVSFSILEGESLGLLGESGSGKTTIARCLLGLATPDSGRIELGAIDLSSYAKLSRSDFKAARSMMQVVFQDPYSSLNPSLSIGSALNEALSYRADTVGKATPSVEQMLELVGLPVSYRHRKPSGLSGGERQRVAIARALAVNPRLLICDEPVAALDVSVQAQVIELLREIQVKHQVSMLFITHDLSVARQITDRVIVLYKGQIVEEGATDKVLDLPTHPYTQRLLASTPEAKRDGALGMSMNKDEENVND